MFKPSRAGQIYCTPKCRDQHKVKAKTKTQEKYREAAADPFIALKNTTFIQGLLRQIVRHGSIDCLVDFPLEQLYQLHLRKMKLTFLCGEPFEMCHRIPCREGGAYHPDNLAILPKRFNNSGVTKNAVLPFGRKWRPHPTKPLICDTLDQAWKHLRLIFENRLINFSQSHPNLNTTFNFQAAGLLIDVPHNHSLKGILEMNNDSLCALLRKYNIELEPTEYELSPHPEHVWYAYLNELQRQARCLANKPKQLSKLVEFIKLVNMMHREDPDLVPRSVLDTAVCGLWSQAWDELLKISFTPSEQFGACDDIDYFETSDPDTGKRERIDLTERPNSYAAYVANLNDAYREDEPAPANLLADLAHLAQENATEAKQQIAAYRASDMRKTLREFFPHVNQHRLQRLENLLNEII